MKFKREVFLMWDGSDEDGCFLVGDAPDEFASVGTKTRIAKYRLVEEMDVSAKTVISVRKRRHARSKARRGGGDVSNADMGS